MNTYQTQLFNELSSLVAYNEAFYKQEFVTGGHTYWIYNYRLASYTDFIQPGAIECRGVMFEVDADGNAIRLAALPMPKFFNLNENPMSMNLDLTDIDEILVKADGSLMSTYEQDEVLKIKSKGSISSEQCIAAMNWLDDSSCMIRFFAEELLHTTVAGWTVNMEWCSPIHRIVLGYEHPHLMVLNARNRETGEYMSYGELVSRFGNDFVIERILVDDPAAFVASIPTMADDIEGFVVRMKSGQRVKIKTEKYLSLHHAKDSVNNPRRLFEAILDEGIDDLRSMFHTDAVAMKMIDEMQTKVDHLYNSMVNTVESFYEENKHLTRKDYAIKGQRETDPYFGLAMTRYLGKPVDYKGFLKSRYKEFGIRDSVNDGMSKADDASDLKVAA